MATAPKTNPPPPPTASPTQKEVIVQGYSIQILGFIPIPKNDLRKQAEVPLLLLDIQEGKKPLSDLLPLLKDIEHKQAHIGKRVSTEQIASWKKPVAPVQADEDEPHEDN